MTSAYDCASGPLFSVEVFAQAFKVCGGSMWWKGMRMYALLLYHNSLSLLEVSPTSLCLFPMHAE